jgi:hypothetical protein
MPLFVIPTKGRIQTLLYVWIPTFAGRTLEANLVQASLAVAAPSERAREPLAGIVVRG